MAAAVPGGCPDADVGVAVAVVAQRDATGRHKPDREGILEHVPDLIGRQPTERTALLLAAVEPVSGKIGIARV
jgi:hypothetical protein